MASVYLYVFFFSFFINTSIQQQDLYCHKSFLFWINSVLFNFLKQHNSFKHFLCGQFLLDYRWVGFDALPLTSTTKDMETIFSSPLKADRPIYCTALTVHDYKVPLTYKTPLDICDYIYSQNC